MTRFSFWSISAFAAMLAIVGLSACGGDAPTPPPPDADGGPADDANTPPAPCSSSGGMGAVPGIDSCVLTSVHVCQNDFCHGAKGPAADLMLTQEFLTGPSVKLLIDKPNVGKPGVTSTTDVSGCPPAFAKIIDSSNPEKSLILTKLASPQACGQRMPIIGTFATSDRDCVLSWLKSVIAVCGPAADGG